jgi:hypothetical protein
MARAATDPTATRLACDLMNVRSRPARSNALRFCESLLEAVRFGVITYRERINRPL